MQEAPCWGLGKGTAPVDRMVDLWLQCLLGMNPLGLENRGVQTTA